MVLCINGDELMTDELVEFMTNDFDYGERVAAHRRSKFRSIMIDTLNYNIALGLRVRRSTLKWPN